MNKRQWKKYNKKKKSWILNRVEANIIYQNIFKHIISNETISDDCGIRIEKPMRFKARELGNNENPKEDNDNGRKKNV